MTQPAWSAQLPRVALAIFALGLSLTAACGADRNKNQAKADWQFTTDDARVKLKALYPIFPAQNG